MAFVKKFFKILFWLSLICSLLFLFLPIPLPSQASILPSLMLADPVQTRIDTNPYLWQVKNQTYQITPLYDYEITGLVVSDYTSANWLDYTHKNDPAQTKDLCLIWGDNLKNGVYRDLKYKHGEFTCFVEWNNAQRSLFNQNQLSNNHLIPTTPGLADLINHSQIGDQVLIKGRLVNYALMDKSNHILGTRNTSIIREDRGCEVILVTDYQTLKKPSIPLLPIKSSLLNLLFISGLTNILLFIFF